MTAKFRFTDALCTLCQRTRTKPSGFVGGRRNLSNNTTIKSKLPASNGMASIRCYTGFNFLNPSFERMVPHKGPWEKLHVRTVFGEQSQEFSRQDVQNFECSVLETNTEGEDDFAELDYPLPTSGDITSKLLTAKRDLIGKDDFAELDCSLPTNGHITSKLLTEKRHSKKYLLRNSAKSERKLCTSDDGEVLTKNAASKMSFPIKSSSKKTPTKLDNHLSDLRSTLEETKHKTEKEKKENQKSSKHVVIEKMPPSISLLQLTEAVSVYGEVSTAFMRKCNGAFNSCHIEFKSIESSEKAVAAKWVSFSSYRLPIRSLHDPGTGPNSTSMADTQWWVGAQMSNLIDGVRKQLNMKRIYLEDLEDLHNAVVHLRDFHNYTHQLEEKI